MSLLKLLARRKRANPNSWGLPKVDLMIDFEPPKRNTFHGGRLPGEADRFVERLRLMMRQRKPEQQFTGVQIAEFCGVSRQYIDIVERRALHKLRKALPRDFREALLA